MNRRTVASWGVLALLSSWACDSNAPPPQGKLLRGTLDVDLRGKVDVSIRKPSAAEAIDIELTFAAGSSSPVSSFRASGAASSFPEAKISLYSAHSVVPTVPGGPCSGLAMFVALSLSQRDPEPRLAGSFTIYCGDKVDPAGPARIVRLTGVVETTSL